MWDDARQLNAIAVTLTLIAAAFLAWAMVGWVTRLPAFAFREVVVTTPLARTSGAHLESVIRGELTGTFFTMNLDAARASLGRVPWVRSVALRRQWPRRLEIEVDEHEPFARWNDNALVDANGEVFAANYAGELPEFGGPDGHSALMTARYREWSALLAPLALRLTGLNLSARGGWQLRAEEDGGPLTLDVGRDDVSGRLARFLSVYARTVAVLAHAGTHVDHVDLRYRNGFAARMPGFHEKPARKVS
ncbi:MAG TPA: cell division protein FtsQ/DivIB [Casimicrobiaceae bacterium]|jgi:cell division protein FtsQ